MTQPLNRSTPESEESTDAQVAIFAGCNPTRIADISRKSNTCWRRPIFNLYRFRSMQRLQELQILQALRQRRRQLRRLQVSARAYSGSATKSVSGSKLIP
jgi:hypothetical protein